MIEALNNLGKLVLAGGKQDFVEALVQSIDADDEKAHIILIDFDTESRRISVGAKKIEKVGDRTALQYLWIGNEPGNPPQWYVTTDNIEYLLSQTIPNLIAKLPKDSGLARLLTNCRDKFFVDLGIEKGAEQRYRYVFDVSIISDMNTLDIYKRVKKAKKTVQEVAKAFYNYLKKETGLTRKEVQLFTLLVDGQPIATEQEYRNLVGYAKVDALFEEARIGVCGACGFEKPVTSDTTKLKFKYYIVDKINFAHEFDEDFTTNLSLCSDCYKHILAAETLVSKYLSARIGYGNNGVNVYIIPQFLVGDNLVPKDLDNWLKRVKFAFETMTSFKEKWTQFEDELETLRERKAPYNNYFMNLLFYQRSQQELKVLNLIQDVPPSRTMLITETISKVEDLGVALLGESRNWNWALSFNKIFYLFPPKLKDRKTVEYRQLLHIFDCIISGKPLDYRLLMEEFVELIQIYRYDRFERYGLQKPQELEIQFIRAVLLANLFLVYGRELKILPRKGGKEVDLSAWQLDEEIVRYIKEMGFSECETGLFLLGYLLGEAANAQYNDGKTSKPILDKLNYQGMDFVKVQRLALEVFEKLKQYKKLSLPMTEAVNACAMHILSKYSTNWPLNHLENVFYIVSGYAYCTNRVLRKAAERKEKQGEGGAADGKSSE